MLQRRYGRIVNIGGEAWRTGAPYHTLLAGIGNSGFTNEQINGMSAQHVYQTLIRF